MGDLSSICLVIEGGGMSAKFALKLILCLATITGLDMLIWVLQGFVLGGGKAACFNCYLFKGFGPCVQVVSYEMTPQVSIGHDRYLLDAANSPRKRANVKTVT